MNVLHRIDDRVGDVAAGLLARARARSGRNARHLMRDVSVARGVLYLLLALVSWNPLVTVLAAVLVPFEMASWRFNAALASEIETPSGHRDEILRTSREKIRLLPFRIGVLAFDAVVLVLFAGDLASTGPEAFDAVLFDGALVLVAALWTLYVYAGCCPPAAPGSTVEGKNGVHVPSTFGA